jgi:hypothetical protein
MSEEVLAINAQTSAILEELYDARGQPDELDDAFLEEYFRSINSTLGLQPDGHEPIIPHKTEAKLKDDGKKLTYVDIPAKNDRFRVSDLGGGELTIIRN